MRKRQDTFHLRDHGTLAHLITMTAIARELRRAGWRAHTTFQLPTNPNLSPNGPAPEVDVYAHRVVKKVNGNRRTSEGVSIGIEVEEKYSRQTILDKWTKYSIMVDRLYFVYLSPPASRTRAPLFNTKIIRLSPKVLKAIHDISKQLRRMVASEIF
jgi:hypothetical protein